MGKPIGFRNVIGLALILLLSRRAHAKDSGLHVVWQEPTVGSGNQLGSVVLQIDGRGTVGLLSPTITAKSGTLVCREARWDSGRTRLTIVYALGNTPLNVELSPTVTEGGLSVHIEASSPLVTGLNFGQFSSSLNARPIATPYYTSRIYFLPDASVFANAWWDWHTTNATEIYGSEEQYHPKTDGSLNPVREDLVIAVSANVDSVFPSPGNPPSPYLAKVAGKMVMDISDKDFSLIGDELAELKDYGIGNGMCIIQVWQHNGFDNGLPEHFPPNAAMGGEAALKLAIEKGNSAGNLMALHENYVDYYPNYPKFTLESVSKNSDGTPEKAFLSSKKAPASTSDYPPGWAPLASAPGLIGIQSFAAKPDWMTKNAETQSPLIHESLGTTADYQDVLSSLAISKYVDMDASQPGAGMLTTWMKGDIALWNYERKVHGGPVLGEGGNHWYYSGLLDGVQAQLGAGSIVPQNSGPGLALFVDFDLLKIHPLQVNHGMGLYDRWTLSQNNTMSPGDIDAYRTQEVAFGHAPYLGTGVWSDVMRAFVESNLVTPVAKSYGTSKVSLIEYRVNGAWVSSSAAAQAGQFTAVRVTYENGLTVVANSSTTPFTFENLTIPQWGWAAISDTLHAYTAMSGSTVCDFAQTPTSIFANSRNQGDKMVGMAYASPSAAVQQGAGRTFSLTITWQPFRTLNTEARDRAFVHFVDASGKIAFASDFASKTTLWKANQPVVDGPLNVAIPAGVADGAYSVRIGLYEAGSGKRLALVGNNDGSTRYTVGTLTVSGQGTQVTFTPQSAPQAAPGSLVNFGPVQTDGMISIKKEGTEWVLRPFPRYRNLTVLLKTSDFPAPSSIKASGDTETTLSPVTKGEYWQLTTNGAKFYSWPAGK